MAENPGEAPGQPVAAIGEDGDPASSPALERHFTVADLFLGEDGIRAGWAIGLFLLLREALSYVIVPLARALFPSLYGIPGPMAPRTLLSFEGPGLLCLAGATAVMAVIEHRSIADYGFGRRNCMRNFGQGLLWGAGLLSVLVAALHATGLLVFQGRLLFGRSALHFGVLWFGGFLIVALTEEIFLRGFIQFTLTRGLAAIYRRLLGPGEADALGFWSAAVILSFVFGLGHHSNPGESPLGLLSAGLIGLVFCLSLWRTGTLWWAIGFHAAWDWAQSCLYGVPDSGIVASGHIFATHPVGRPYLSGGVTGPEGSLLMLPVLVIALAAVQLTLRRTNAGYREHMARPLHLDLA